jgi:predicted N-acetyltransferase YhbS
LIGRLARDLKFAKSGVGGNLLMSALCQAYRQANSIGAMAVIVDAKDEAAAGFYSRFGFLPLEGSRLFLPMKDVPKWNPSVNS